MDVVIVPSLSAFERRLDRLWLDDPARYNREINIGITGRSVPTAHRLMTMV